MDGVRSIESLAAGDVPHNSFRTLGPALVVSMGYLDFGKWLVAVEAGSRFGYDLVLLVLLFNLSAILCQYLSSCIGIVTGKNLAEICRQEYSQKICVVLGLQAGLSLLTSELTMIAGIVVGFNLVFESNDPITVVCCTSVVINLLPYALSLLGKRKAGMFNAYVSGFTLVCFVLGLLVSHPKTPVNTNVMFPKLSGESAYSLMALLGTNIIVHNFYTHSSVVQVQRRFQGHTLGSLFHDHLFSILFAFSGIFLVNYILLITAADETKNTMAINFQDARLLMNQRETLDTTHCSKAISMKNGAHEVQRSLVIPVPQDSLKGHEKWEIILWHASHPRSAFDHMGSSDATLDSRSNYSIWLVIELTLAVR